MSAFEDLLHTNYAPTSEEAERIKEFCAGPEAEIVVLDAEIHRLEELLAQARSKRESLAAVVKSHRDLLSPIRHLSPELLQTIFSLCLPEDRNPVLHASEAPVLLGRVCRRWREIGYNTSELWAAIHIVVPAHLPVRSSAMQNSVMDWLSRSAQQPLRISFYAERPCQSSDVQLFLNTLLSLSERWQHVSFTLPFHLIVFLDTELKARRSLPLLRSFEIRNVVPYPANQFGTGYEPPVTSENIELLTALKNARGLNRLQVVLDEGLDRIPPPRDSGLPPQSLASFALQDLTIDYMSLFDGSVASVLEFLRPCRSLRRLALSGNLVQTVFHPESLTPVLLPNLEYLALGVLLCDKSEAYLPALILDVLVAPSLTELGLRRSYTIPLATLDACLGGFLGRSQCSLRRLDLEVQPYSPNESTLSCFDDMLDLTYLSIVCPTGHRYLNGDPLESFDSSHVFLARLTSQECCPQLRHLTILDCLQQADYSLNFDILLNIIKPRAPSGFCLNLQDRRPSIADRVDSPLTIPESFRMAVKELEERETGLRVILPEKEVRVLPSAWKGQRVDNAKEWWES